MNLLTNPLISASTVRNVFHFPGFWLQWPR